MLLNDEEIRPELESARDLANILACALVTPQGTVLFQAEMISQNPSNDDSDFPIKSRLQTRIYGLYSAVIWQEMQPDAKWVGFDVSGIRVIIMAVESLLLIVAGSTEKDTWGWLYEVAAKLSSSLSGKIRGFKVME